MASRSKCLVIEDDEDATRLIGTIPAGRGFDVHFAETGAEALLIAFGSALSLIILDLGCQILTAGISRVGYGTLEPLPC